MTVAAIIAVIEFTLQFKAHAVQARENLKVTTELDLRVAEMLLRER